MYHEQQWQETSHTALGNFGEVSLSLPGQAFVCSIICSGGAPAWEIIPAGRLSDDLHMIGFLNDTTGSVIGFITAMNMASATTM